MSDAWLGLRRIVRELEKEGDLRIRLASACKRLMKIRARDLPAEAREDHHRLVSRLGFYQGMSLPREIREMLAGFDKRQLIEAKKCILRIYLLVDRYQPRPHRAAGGSGTTTSTSRKRTSHVHSG